MMRAESRLNHNTKKQSKATQSYKKKRKMFNVIIIEIEQKKKMFSKKYK